MPLVKKPMRYAHPEGHTDVCYFTGEKGGLITCGTDGDVRAWLNLMDDDPSATCVSEQATSIISKKEKIYVGNDNNTVQILNHPDLEKEGIVTRFSANVSALATTKNSSLIVSGACDMRIQVTDISKSDSFELTGHEAPILGLSLDPDEEYIASSSCDGTIRIWKIKEKKSINILNNVLPKCNSFTSAKVYGTPSFSEEYLAYPKEKKIIVLEKSSWKEALTLTSVQLKNDLSICKFSDCGTLLAACSIYGEVIVWDIKNKEVIGYTEHQQNAKITSLVWKPDSLNEIAFCDNLGQLSCIDVLPLKDESSNNSEAEPMKVNGNADTNLNDFNDDFDVDDEDDDNVISLDKIKASVLNEDDDDKKTISDVVSENKYSSKRLLPEINLQEPFQPGSSPVHLLSRYMVWNDVGIVMCFDSEDGEDSNIEVNFHDVNVHHSMHIKNYAQHKMAALSDSALIFAAPIFEDAPSKIVVVALQGWGAGNKEWSLDLPEGEEALAVAAGSNFVAVATSTRMLRLFMPGGTQREVIALPGLVVSMNGFGNCLAVAYHSSIGAFDDQIMSLLWIRINGPNLKSQTLPIPLSPASKLMWLGFSDVGSPVAVDSEGIINVYDKKSCLWRVGSDTNRENKGKLDNYFIIGIDESERTARCILCKGSHYPPTTPRPIVTEIPLTIPLCEPKSEKSVHEAKVWQLGSNPLDEKEAVLALIAAACKNNIDYRAVELCQQIASQKVLELAVRYAGRVHKMSLANKLESISDTKEAENIDENGTQEDMFKDDTPDQIEVETPLLSLTPKVPEIEIKPLTPSQTFGRRSNPFKKKSNTPVSKGLMGLDVLSEPKPITPARVEAIKPKPKKSKTPVSFISWFNTEKSKLSKEFPDLDQQQLTKFAFAKFKENKGQDKNDDDEVSNADQKENVNGETEENNIIMDDDRSKKRKSADDHNDVNNQPKRSASSKLAAFARQT